MKRNKIIIFIARIVGIFILILGIRMIGAGVYNYIDEHNQADWVSATAYVVDVTSEYSGSSIRHMKRVDYDITYQYEVNENVYSDILYNRSKPLALGDTVKIKYNPKIPSESTDILSPSLRNMVVFIGFGSVLSLIGFFMSGLWALIQKVRRKEPLWDNKKHSRMGKTKKAGDGKNVRSVVIAVGKKIVPIVVMLALIMISIKFFPGTQAKDTETFRKAAETAGYTTYNSTSELREEWRVGSMLEESYSFNNGNIRMDFGVMDTADSSTRLYDGMTLPITEGEVTNVDGMVHEIYSVENPTSYAAKVRIRDTIIYVYTLSEYKDDAVTLLDELGYWKE